MLGSQSRKCREFFSDFFCKRKGHLNTKCFHELYLVIHLESQSEFKLKPSVQRHSFTGHTYCKGHTTRRLHFFSSQECACTFGIRRIAPSISHRLQSYAENEKMASAEKHVHFAKCFILYIFVIVLSTINLFEHKCYHMCKLAKKMVESRQV